MDPNLCNSVQGDTLLLPVNWQLQLFEGFVKCNLNKIVMNFAKNKDFVDKFGRYCLKWHVRLSGRLLLEAKNMFLIISFLFQSIKTSL